MVVQLLLGSTIPDLGELPIALGFDGGQEFAERKPELASGVHPKIASERLGHSKIGITLDTYSHVLPGMQEGAVAQLDKALNAVKTVKRS